MHRHLLPLLATLALPLAAPGVASAATVRGDVLAVSQGRHALRVVVGEAVQSFHAKHALASSVRPGVRLRFVVSGSQARRPRVAGRTAALHFGGVVVSTAGAAVVLRLADGRSLSARRAPRALSLRLPAGAAVLVRAKVSHSGRVRALVTQMAHAAGSSTAPATHPTATDPGQDPATTCDDPALAGDDPAATDARDQRPNVAADPTADPSGPADPCDTTGPDDPALAGDLGDPGDPTGDPGLPVGDPGDPGDPGPPAGDPGVPPGFPGFPPGLLGLTGNPPAA